MYETYEDRVNDALKVQAGVRAVQNVRVGLTMLWVVMVVLGVIGALFVSDADATARFGALVGTGLLVSLGFVGFWALLLGIETIGRGLLVLYGAADPILEEDDDG